LKNRKKYFVLLFLVFRFSQSFAYRLKDEDVVVVNGIITTCVYDISTKGNVIEIPNILDGHTITGIGDHAFSVAGKIAIVTLPTTLKTIGIGVFEGHALTSIDIPAGVTSIGNRAFYGNALARVNLPAGLQSIAEETFANNQLTSITLPAGLKTIGSNAFNNNKITSLSVPNTVEAIGSQAFLANKISDLNFQAPCQVKEISPWCFADNDIKNLTIPNSVLVLGDGAFQYNGNLTNVVFAANLLKINRNAFFSCNLSSVTFPESLIFIGRYAFDGNNSLTNLKLPVSTKNYQWNDSNGDKHNAGDILTEKKYSYVARIPYSLKDEDVEVVNGVINNCIYFRDITNIGNLITIPAKLDGQDIVGIAGSVFYNCGISELVLPAGIRNISNWAFATNEIIHLTLPNSLETIGEYAFNFNCINSLSFEAISKLEKIGIYAFSSNRLVQLDFPRSLVSIEKNAFNNNSLRSVNFEANSKLMTIGSQAFKWNWPISYFTLPDPKANGYEYWLDWNSSKYSINLVVDNFESFYKIPVEYTLTDADVVVVDGIIVSCKLSNPNVNILTIPDRLDGQEIIGIGERVFQRMGLIGVNLPSSLKNIYTGAFTENELLKITIPSNVVRIDIEAFSRNNINELIFEKNSQLKQINEMAFSNNKISSLTLPDNLNHIGSSAFSGNKLSNEIIIPNNTEYIGEYAFSDNQIPKLTFGKNSTLSYLGASAFQSNKISNDIFIPLTLTEIPDYAFANNNISKIVVHDGILEYGNGAFQNNNPSLSIVLHKPSTIPQVTHFFGWRDNNTTYHNAGETITDFSNRYKAVIDQFFVIEFVVTDNINNPIENASIQFYNSTLITNADGIATIGPVMRGNQNYIVSANGCYEFKGSVDVQDNMTVTVTLTRYYNVSITVVDSNDIPIAGASVVIYGFTLTSGADGKVSIDLSNGDYSFVASALGYQESTSSIVVLNSENSKTVKLNHVLVNYFPNGGTGVSYTETTYGNIYVANYNQFTKVAHNFSHWNTKSDNSGVAYAEKESISLKYMNLDLYAIWAPVNYNITYHLDGGTNSSKNPATYNIESEIIFLPASKPSLYFASWVDVNKKRVNSIEKGTVGDIQLWAVYTTEPTYYIDYFNLENASHKNQLFYTKFDLPLVFTDAHKRGYKFVGWYEDALFSKKITTIPIGKEKNYSVYARWGDAVDFSITYHLDGGINNPINPFKYTIESRPIIFEFPSKNGAKFAGWYCDKELKTKITELPTGSAGDTILFAKWDLEVFDIQYVLDGGTNHFANPTQYTIESSQINFEYPSKNGETFDGWYSDKELTHKITGIPTGSTGNKTVYAKWKLDVFNIRYELNEGTNHSANPTQYTYGSSLINFEPASKKGAKFVGWYIDKELTQEITGIPTGSNGDKIVYAKWELETFAIQYVLARGTNHLANPTQYTIESSQIIFESPSKSGATFVCWYSDKELTQKITGIPTGSMGNKTVFAKWIDVFSVNFIVTTDGINSAQEVDVVVNKTQKRKTDSYGFAHLMMPDGSSIEYSIEINGIIIKKGAAIVSGSDQTIRVEITDCYIRWYDVIFCDNGKGLWTDFIWYKDNAMISEEQFFHNPGGIKDGKYKLVITSVAGVKYIWEKEYKSAESWQKLDEANHSEMSIFPNPVTSDSNLNITILENTDLKNSNIIIYNNIGTLVKIINELKYMNEINVDANFSPGLYHVILRDDKNKRSIGKSLIIK